jgi:DNA-directed RNA polymerase subunit alpha
MKASIEFIRTDCCNDYDNKKTTVITSNICFITELDNGCLIATANNEITTSTSYTDVLKYLDISTVDSKDVSVSSIGLPARASSVLKTANINTLSDLIQQTEKDLLIKKNFGRKSLQEVKSILRELGLCLKA